MTLSTHLVDELGSQAAATVAEIKPRLRGWLHAVTAPLAFLSFLVMLVLAEDVGMRAAVSVFMVSALLVFSTSAVYHLGTWSPRGLQELKRIDHANIYLLIAGSSTPFALLLLSPQHATTLLAVMWTGAVLGVVSKILWLDSPRWLNSPLYLLLGCAPVMFVGDFVDSTPLAPLVLLGAGGLLYSVGAVVYAVRRPNPSPRYFGFHEVFHALTIVAFTTHYAGVSLLLHR